MTRLIAGVLVWTVFFLATVWAVDAIRKRIRSHRARQRVLGRMSRDRAWQRRDRERRDAAHQRLHDSIPLDPARGRQEREVVDPIREAEEGWDDDKESAA